MSPWTIAALVLLALWVLANLKTSRPDGRILKIHPYRRIMFYIMPTRNESVVYFDGYIDADKLLKYLDTLPKELGANITHAVVAAANMGLATAPAMNRFVVGRRLYERDGRWLTFSMKRKKLDRKAKLATVKLKMEDNESFAELCGRINGQIKEERSDKVTRADKEFNLFNLLPRPLLAGAASLLRSLDYHNLLPGFFIKDDPMYTSIFIANLGSLNMHPGYHHLYEYGTCPLFIMIGKIEERPVVVNGEVQIKRQLHVRYTYDERIDDGLNSRFGMKTLRVVLEDPERWLGGLGDKAKKPLWPDPELQAVIDASDD